MKLSNSGITDFYSSGQKLAEVMTKRGSLFPPGEVVPMNVLLGAERTDQKEFFRGFRHHVSKWRPELLPKFGYDFSATSNDIDDMLNTFEELGIRENIWMGDGRTNCLPQSYSRLEKILARRDSGKSSRLAPSKVYSWTVDRKSTMRKLLQLGVDAIIVNHPDRMHSLVTDEFRDSLFLATRETDPWKHIKATNVAVPLAQGCSRWKSTCWKYVNRNNWCWTTATCNKSNDCWRNIHCS